MALQFRFYSNNTIIILVLELSILNIYASQLLGIAFFLVKSYILETKKSYIGVLFQNFEHGLFAMFTSCMLLLVINFSPVNRWFTVKRYVYTKFSMVTKWAGYS